MNCTTCTRRFSTKVLFFSGLPEQISNRTNCQNGTLDVTFSPFCSVRRIAIKRLSYECISGTTCSDNIPTRLVSRSMLANAVSRVSGESHGVIGVDPHNCLNQHTFMKINYYCISREYDIIGAQRVFRITLRCIAIPPNRNV